MNSKIKIILIINLVVSRFEIFESCQSKIQSTSEWKSIKAIAIIKGNYNNSPIRGTVIFEQDSPETNMRITANITGLTSGGGFSRHGFHIHQKGITVTSDDQNTICNSNGDHYNPFNQSHGGLNSPTRHMGDFGNVISNENGTIFESFESKYSTLFGPLSIIGRSIVLHKDEDDEGMGKTELSKTRGNSGSRIACGIIGYLI